MPWGEMRLTLAKSLVSSFEAVGCGVAYNIAAWQKAPAAAEKISALVKKMWSQKAFTERIGTGVTGTNRIKHSIPFGREFFVP